MKIYFNFNEIEFSNTAKANNIDNSVPKNLFNNILRSFYGMQKVRELLGVPCTINSWYRCKALNDLLKGSSKQSAHMQGLAIDFVVKGDLDSAFKKIADSKLEFDQLIIEKNSSGSRWIHISFDPKNRREVKSLYVK